MFLSHATYHDSSTSVFTDGSKSDVGIGFGALFPEFDRSGNLPAIAFVFTTELSAILLAIRVIFSMPVGRFTIFSDSLGALSFF